MKPFRMAAINIGFPQRVKQKMNQIAKKGNSLPITYKLIVSFLLISIFSNIFFTIAGITFIGNRIISEAQERVRNDLNSAREIYFGELRHITDVVQLTSRRPIIQEIFDTGVTENIQADLNYEKKYENLDILTVIDKSGTVVLRTNYPYNIGDNLSQQEIIKSVLNNNETIASSTIVPIEFLAKESPRLAESAHFVFIDTPMARARPDTEETSGMLLAVATPVFNDDNLLIGTLFGAVVLNRNYTIVDMIKQTVFQGMMYKGKDIGTATIFQDDVRISTNVLTEQGTRAIGTRIAEDVYNQVVVNGSPWIGRAYVVNNWYITAYEPIRNISDKVIGILYVGILEQKYTDLRQSAVLTFLLISLGGVLASIAISYTISRNILIPVQKLASASKELAKGNLEIRVEKTSDDELGELADGFNSMAYALKERDERLKEFTRKKFMESERLALVGQLAANVAHELNNPLQGIVTYSHLLLENNIFDEPTNQNIRKIVTQSNRCRDIIRGLLDFSRQRKPDKTLCDINSIVQESISFVENQALFHNIEIVMNLDNSLPKTIIDPSQIVRVFINLIVNAAEAMEGNGRLSISSIVDRNTKCIEIEVTDTGPGIPEENIEKIFDPFFTTKETGHGVGLGLAISYGIIKEHKGSISVESKIGQGTTFTIRFPIAAVKNGDGDEL
jgi:two-component system NtrC family sensor kinase